MVCGFKTEFLRAGAAGPPGGAACCLAAVLMAGAAFGQTGAATTTGRPAGAGASTVTGEVVADLACAQPPTMFMPSAVAVAEDKQVYVADGANDRIVWFDPQGGFAGQITAVAGQSLCRPMSVKIDSQGWLWIADTGSRRVVATDLKGHFEKVLRIDRAATSQPADITDVAVSPDGRTAWLVDNDSDVLVRMDIATQRAEVIGQRGEEPGQMRHPFAIAVDGDGEAFVTDVINGRVDVFGPSGHYAHTIGTYGARPGELYRPGGIALDPAGRVWVSDGVLRVVQVFSGDGTFLGVLRDAEGQPLRFDVPMGLAFGGEGDLFVVELGANRVRRVRVRVHPNVPPPVVQAPPDVLALKQPRTCTACHLDWIWPLNMGAGTELVPPIHSTTASPYASREVNCLSCHDGVATDSRQSVWRGYGHAVAVSPLAGMQVPAELPLPDGRLACRTCHTAHNRPEGVTIAKAVWLRTEQGPAQLCSECHAGYAAGPAAGMHPVGPTTRPVPAELLHTGDESARNEVTCLVCHRAHGADQQALLEVPGPPANLCRPCHPSQEAVRAGPHDLAKDPRAWPAASAATGDVCLACHRIHGTSQTGGFRMGLARGSPSTDAPCLPCHPGAAPGAEGQMSLVHPGLVAAASPVAAGLTVTAAPAGKVTIGCGTCHDPHASGAGQETGALLLRAPAGGTPDSLCLECHKEAAGIHATDHGPLKLKTAGFEAVTGCRPCHLVHADERAIVRHLLWSAPLAAQATWSPLDLAADRYCVCCHRGRGPAAVPPVSTHPTVLMFNVTGPDQRGFLPLFGPADQVSPFGSLSCRTCHLAHGRGSPTALRLEAEAPGAAATQAGLWYLRTFTHESLCVNCHGVEALRRFLFFHDLQRRKGGMWFDPAAGVPPPRKQP